MSTYSLMSSPNYVHVYLCVHCSKLLFDPVEETTGYEPLPEDRPGGFNWGEQQQQQEQAAADAPQDDDPH